MQRCIISENLYHSIHEKGNHGYGGVWGGSGASYHHNLLANHSSRNPRFNGARGHTLPYRESVDYRNNVIYNWGFNSAYGGEPSNNDGSKANINMVANYYKYGPGTRTGAFIIVFSIQVPIRYTVTVTGMLTVIMFSHILT